MNDKLQEMLIKVINIENQGYGNEALVLIDKLLKIFPDDEEIILLQKAEIEFELDKKLDALVDYISSYECNHNKATRDEIIQKFYDPYKEKYDEIYQNNCKQISKYKYYFGEQNYDKSKVCIVYSSEEVKIYYSIVSQKFIISNRIEYNYSNYTENDYVMIENCMWAIDCVKAEESIAQLILPNYKKPIYLIYDVENWIVFNMTEDISQLLEDEKSVIILGEKMLRKTLEDDWFPIPSKFLTATNAGNYLEVIQEYVNEKCLKRKECAERLGNYYTDELVDDHIKSRNIKILFITSRYTTILQYHTRDFERAAKELGYETELLIEKDNNLLINDNIIYRTIDEFRPDIVFEIDHFRYESIAFDRLSSIVFVTWIQDPMQHILDPDTAHKIGERDYILNHLINLKDLMDVNYPRNKMIDAPIPASKYKYHKYELSEVDVKDIERYSSDICIVCHASDVDGYIQEYVTSYGEGIQEYVRKLLYAYINDIDSGMGFLYSQNDFRDYVESYMGENNIDIYPSKEVFVQKISQDMYMWLNQRVYRQKMVDALLEAGLTNIKLWGKGWSDNPNYAPYAMGVAENGKELSLIYQCSKIVLGNNIMTTAAARAWETMLSGGFYMSNYIPPENDVCDIRNIMQIGTELVMFVDTKDMVDKIKYYLENEDERNKMILIGHEIAINKMTYESLCERMIDSIK